MKALRLALAGLAACLLLGPRLHAATPAEPVQPVTIAAAADLKFALDAIKADYLAAHPDERIEIIYGSSGRFHTQIRQAAPFDLYFSADIAYPEELARTGHAAGPVVPYAIGRLVLWSTSEDASKLTLADLRDPRFTRIAIANPRHAPYGARAVEALTAAGLHPDLEPRYVYGENISQTAQLVLSGNARVGLIALSLALQPQLAERVGYTLIDEKLHAPLLQGFIVTRRAADNPSAHRFAAMMQGDAARAVLTRYGFVLPKESPAPTTPAAP